MSLRHTKTIDLRNEAEKIRDDGIPELLEAREEIVSDLEEEYDDWKEIPNGRLADVSQLEDKVKELRGRASLFEEIVEGCDEDTEFELQELSAGQKYRIVDEVNEASYEVDMQHESVRGVPKRGAGMIKTLDEVVVSAPDYLEEEYDTVADYPDRLVTWLEGEANDLLTSGTEADVEDFTTLKERIGSKK